MRAIGFLRKNARWLAAGFLMTFMSAFGQTYFIALFSGEIRSELGLSHGEFGTIYGAATLLSAFSLIWVGKIVDRDNLALIGIFVSAMLGLAALGMSVVAGPVSLFLVIFLLRLFGQGMMTHTSQTAMGRWFAATRGRALAVSGLGFPTSEALFPIFVVSLLSLLDWRDVWVLAGALLFLVSAPVLFGLLKINRTPLGSANQETTASGQHQWTRAEVLRDPIFYLLLPGMLAPSFVFTGIFFHQVHLVQTKGWELSWFAASFPLYALISVLTSLLAGVLIDRYSARRLLPVILLPEAVGAILMAQVAGPWIIPAFMVLIGMTAGMLSTISGALWPEIYGTRHLGAVRSLTMSAMVFSSAASPFALGVMIDGGIDFGLQLIGMGVYMIVATGVLILVSRVLQRRFSAAPI